jgi:hypothetical protein
MARIFKIIYDRLNTMRVFEELISNNNNNNNNNNSA